MFYFKYSDNTDIYIFKRKLLGEFSCDITNEGLLIKVIKISMPNSLENVKNECFKWCDKHL